MKSFAIYLEQSKKPEWKENYLNYDELKTLLSRFAERRSRISLVKSPNEVQRLYPQILATVRRKDDDDFVLLENKTADRNEGGKLNLLIGILCNANVLISVSPH